jgi:tRNA U34 5-methylaminomethyl-2-thiouridine-forming methyltransferase MnmC
VKKITTQDGSTTFYSEQYEQTYHSVSGAMEEAQKKFIEQSEIAKRAASGNIRILDIGFGLGYKSLLAIYFAKKENPDCKIKIVALEKDENILKTEVEVFPHLQSSYELLRYLVGKSLRAKECAQKQNVAFELVFGDAVETIKTLKDSFDIVFLDPFSPKKNPELWTLDFFKDIHKLMSDDAVLTTYSCASIVRKNLKEAGFKVADGPCVGRRSPSTVAYLN